MYLKRFGRFLYAHTSEIAQFYNLGLPLVQLCEFRERLIERDQSR